MMTSGQTRSKRWCFTWNTPTPTDQTITTLKESLEDSVTYAIVGRENAPTTNRVHLQGYVTFTSQKSMRQVKAVLGNQAVHLEVARGTGRENRAYCTKEEQVIEIGELKTQGERKDIARIQEMIEDGFTDVEIAREHFGTWTRIRTAIQEYRRLIKPKRIIAKHHISEFPGWNEILFEENEYSTIFWGESGIGKTSFVKALYPGLLMVSHTDDLRHFQKDEHTAILFDDMDFKHFPRNGQIHILDSDDDRSIHCRYDCAFIPAGTRKFFTTNEDGGNIFDLTDPAIRRRVKVRHLANFRE